MAGINLLLNTFIPLGMVSLVLGLAKPQYMHRNKTKKEQLSEQPACTGKTMAEQKKNRPQRHHSPQKTTTKANDTTTTYPGLASAPSPFTSNVAYTLVSGILSLPAALNMTSSLYIHDLWAAVSFCGSLPMTKRSPMAPEP